jgi:transketolase
LQLKEKGWEDGIMNQSIRKIYGKKLAELGQLIEDIVVLDADLSHSLQTGQFAEKFPNRYWNFGIRERAMVGAAAGLAAAGKIPVTNTFSKMYCLADDIIEYNIDRSKLNVKIVASHYGIEIGPDGSSHHDLRYLARWLCLQNTFITCPADGPETEQIMEKMFAYNGPVILLLSRNELPTINSSDYKFEFGKWTVIREGEDLALLSFGDTLHECLKAAEILKDANIYPSVINTSSLKPFDEDMIDKLTKNLVIISVEDHFEQGFGDNLAYKLIKRNFKGRFEKIYVKGYAGYYKK